VKQHPTCTYTQSSDAADTIYVKRTSIPGVTNPQFTWQEDPHIFRSGGTYHIIYSGSGDRVGWHVYSPDGITGWKDNGYAWSGRDYQKIFCYDGTTTCTAWYKMERPGVVLEDGHPTHITWAVSDVDKDNQVQPGTSHGTKVIVVPFDGVAFDNDFGVPGTGGTGGTGGSTGAGGASGVGGSGSGMGGSGSGGDAATGGRNGSDGGLGGNGSSGGRSGSTGGTTSGLGGNGSGGATGSGGRAGGTSGTTILTSGGTSGAGTGGATAKTGGVTGAGGTTAGSGSQAGGNSGSAGTSTTPSGSASSGCSCSIQGREQASGSGSLLLLAFGLLSLLRRRRPAKSV
jgi:MYXO-CTERM domain-containing protein